MSTNPEKQPLLELGDIPPPVEEGSIATIGTARASYPSTLPQEITDSPYWPVVHALFSGEVQKSMMSVAGAVALSKKVADKLRAGEPENGKEPLSEQQISERVMELAAQMWAQSALQRCEFTTLPNAEGDEATVAFTAVVLHPSDFGQLLSNLEMLCVKTIERIVLEAANTRAMN